MIGTTVSHYKILEKLGAGGMGVVYKALDENLDRTVAIKFLPEHLSAESDAKGRFIQEAKATAALNHPNILGVYDIDERDGSIFFVMEYVEGRTLKNRISAERSGDGIPLRQAIDWAFEIAEGLKAAHDKGVIHRDIKSENIMLASDGHPKIMDFGIAKLKGTSGMTKAGSSLGTLSYMSPEQVKGQSADERSDVWSLGVVFYEMLTGELPFRGEHEAALMYLIAHETAVAPSSHDKRIPPSVDAFVATLLEKDRDRRCRSMGEVINGLRAIARTIAQAAHSGATKAIALLPFENISPDKESDYFSDGLTEEMILSLSRMKNMRVVSRTSTMQYKGTKKDIKTIGRELGARYIVEGSVRKFGDDLRITVQLVDVETDAQLWAEKYKGKLADVFDIQEKVSEQIVDALMVKLTPVEQVVLTKRATLNPEAFDCNLRARDFLNRRTRTSVDMAIRFFQKALEHDPRYADAYAGLGEAYGVLYRDFERKNDWLDRALEVSLKAIMYDSTLSEAYTSLAIAYFGKKSFTEALEACQKAILLDGHNYNAYWILSRIYHSTDRDLDAATALEKAIESNPDFLQAYDDILMIYERLGEKDKYLQALHKAIGIYPQYLEKHPDDAYRRGAFAVALANVGRNDEARSEGEKALELSSSDPIMMYFGACLYAKLHEPARAVALLKNCILGGYENFDWIKRDPDLDNIRNEPGYIELMTGR